MLELFTHMYSIESVHTDEKIIFIYKGDYNPDNDLLLAKFK